MAKLPKWVTPSRQAYLVEVFQTIGDRCLLGHSTCPIASHYLAKDGKGNTKAMRLHEYLWQELIKLWVLDDRYKREAEWQTERKAIHDLGERRYRRGTFSTVAREVFYGKQPLFYLEAIGISGLSLKPFAKVRIASSQVALFVELGDSLKRASKNARRKAIRYGKLTGLILDKVRLAVEDYLNR